MYSEWNSRNFFVVVVVIIDWTNIVMEWWKKKNYPESIKIIIISLMEFDHFHSIFNLNVCLALIVIVYHSIVCLFVIENQIRIWFKHCFSRKKFLEKKTLEKRIDAIDQTKKTKLLLNFKVFFFHNQNQNQNSDSKDKIMINKYSWIMDFLFSFHLYSI